MSNKRFMQGLEIKIDKVLKLRQWCLSYLSLKRKKSSTVLLCTQLKTKRVNYQVIMSHCHIDLVIQLSGHELPLYYGTNIFSNDQVAGLLKSGIKKADWLTY